MPKQLLLHEALIKFNRLINECSFELSKELGILDLKMRYTNCLKIIAGSKDLTYGALAKTLGITKPSVTDLINNLIELGYVQKNQSSDDKRVFYIELTEKGLVFAGYEHLRNNKLIEVIKKSLTEKEIDSLSELISKINKK